ncbi:flagellar basal body rod protein FlgB [Limnobacter litoralis]|uniref:Flagellar basal body rod protein FlgB n=1 Tax=Limnobacter litoralis TaxID=481366 RepID=A0ABQ5YQ88_9BURK|nr:flagellar basal body rod protein FlgB [Limnobacter litoralis]GLR26723.1 flagellar basal body rod protein FlgB [Limnobacter litoralis]
MLDKLTESFRGAADALTLRARRQEVLTSNISNVDTPNYKAVDFDFKAALQAAEKPHGHSSANDLPMQGGLAVTSAGHIAGSNPSGISTAAMLQYRQSVNPSLDDNTVDIDRERAAFSENTVKYEAALRDINRQIADLKLAMGSGN